MMTWPEVKAAIAAGKTTALVYTGGTEQRGPQNVNGGHTLMGRATVKAIALKLGNAIAMPVLPYTPNEANAALPGTIGLTTELLSAILERIAQQAIKTGFTNVILMGDHGGGQPNAYAVVAKKLDSVYAPEGKHVYFCDQVYKTANAAFDDYLKSQHMPVSSHAGIPDTSEMLYLGVDLGWVRPDQIPTAVQDREHPNGIQGRCTAVDEGARQKDLRHEGRLRGEADTVDGGTEVARGAPDVFPKVLAVALAPAAAARAAAQTPAQPRPDSALSVIAISGPREPLPAEKATARIKRFSFIAYGDTRNWQDGTLPQEVHGLVVESLLAKAASLAQQPDPVRFVVSSGDAVVNGQRIDQLNVSFVPLINRITAAGLPYFFAAGNHDVTGAQDLQNPQRAIGLANLLAAHRNLIPPQGFHAAIERLSHLRVRLRQHVRDRVRLEHRRRLHPVPMGAIAARFARSQAVREHRDGLFTTRCSRPVRTGD